MNRLATIPFLVKFLLLNLFLSSLLLSAQALASVTCTDAAGSTTLANEHVTMVINKAGRNSGSIISLQLDGVELLGHGGRGYLDVNDSFGLFVIGSGTTLYSVVQGADFCDLAITHQPDATFPITLSHHYVLRGMEEGFHMYSVYAHAAADVNDSIGQTRTVLRADPNIFDHHSSELFLKGIMPLPADVAASSGSGDLQDATFDLTPFTDANATEYKSVLGKWNYTKYDWTSYQKRHLVHGIYGHGYGLWLVQANQETLNAGPMHQELFEHQTNTTPVLLNDFFGGHYGQSLSLNVTGDFSKTFGPFFLRINQGDTSTDAGYRAMWSDAAQYADPSVHQAFYDSLGIPGYAASSQRATVTGQIVLSSGDSMAGATITLTDNHKPFDQHTDSFQYWVDANADGTFTFSGVRPGIYRLSAFRTGVFDDFHLDDVSVSGPTTAVASQLWTPPDDGTAVFQLGSPDRTAMEYRGGDNYKSYGLFNDFLPEFPTGVNYVFGQSTDRDDWYFVQWKAITPNHPAGARFTVPDYQATFNLNHAPDPSATVTLRVALAAQSSGGTLTPSLNGTAAMGWSMPLSSSVATRSGASGTYLSHTFTFPATSLLAGANTVRFHMSGGGNVLYDAMRMSVSPVDPTLAPQTDLTITNASTGTLVRTQTAGYSVVVSNVSDAASAGPVTVAYSLPWSLVQTSIGGSGWNCEASGHVVVDGLGFDCTRSDSLDAGASYPPITVSVNVASNAPSRVVSTAVVSGGSDVKTINNVASEITTIRSPALVTLQVSAAASTYGGPVTFTANVSAGVDMGVAGTPNPTGTVDFRVGSTSIGTVTLDGSSSPSSPQAVLTTSQLMAGTQDVIAVFQGDDAFSRSTSAAVEVVVAPAQLLVAANSNSRIYGQLNPAFDGTVTGVVNGDNITAIFSSLAAPVSPVGIYEVVPMVIDPDGRLVNYQTTIVKGQLAITPAPLTITADNKSKVLDAENPQFTVGYAGFVLGEDSSVLGGTITCATTASSLSPVGTYPVTCSGQSSANYLITNVPGSLSILYASRGECDNAPGHQILPPVKADGSRIFHDRRIVPARFRVCDALGVSIGAAGTVRSFTLLQATPAPPQDPTPSPGLSPDGTMPDHGASGRGEQADTVFRWEPREQQWELNIDVSHLAAGFRYSYRIELNDGSNIDFQFGVGKRLPERHAAPEDPGIPGALQ